MFQKILPRWLNRASALFPDMRLFGKKEYTCAACGAKFDTQDKLSEHGKAHATQMNVPA